MKTTTSKGRQPQVDLPTIKEMPGHHKIGVVAHLLGISDTTVRQYELGSGIEVQRVQAGILQQRVYSPQNIFDLAAFRRKQGQVKPLPRTIVSFYTPKGGVSKSTLTVELVTLWQAMGYRVLLVDLDPQASATTMFGYDPEADEDSADHIPPERMVRFHFGHLMDLPPFFSASSIGTPAATYADLKDVIKMPYGPNGPHLIPSDLRLMELEWALYGATNRDLLLDYLIEDAIKHPNSHLDLSSYDIICFDCPPATSLITRCALIASDYCIAPTRLDALSTKGISYLASLMNTIQRSVRKSPHLISVPTFFNKQRSRVISLLERLRSRYGGMVTEHMIRESEVFPKTQSMELAHRQPVVLAKPLHPAASEDLHGLALELLENFSARP